MTLGEVRNKVHGREPFSAPKYRVEGFYSAHHEGFYVVTALGFAVFIYVPVLKGWLVSDAQMPNYTLSIIRPRNTDVAARFSDKQLNDVYRYGMREVFKLRLLGELK